MQGLLVQMFEDGQTLQHWMRVAEIFDELDELQGELNLSCELQGLLSPWVPQVKAGEPTLAQLAGPLLPFTPENDPALWTFPTLNKALTFLNQQEVLSSSQWNEKVRRAERSATEQPIVIKLDSQIDAFRKHLQDGFVDGDSVYDFKKRISGTIDATDATIERNFRTSSKRAFLDGVQQVTNTNRFPYVKYVATEDIRTRATHRAMDGKILKVGTPEHSYAVRLQGEYNCRCTLIPLTEKQAVREGLVPDQATPPTIDFEAAESGRLVSDAFAGKVREHEGVVYKIAAPGKQAMSRKEVEIQQQAASAGLAPKILSQESDGDKITKVAMENVANSTPASAETTERDGQVFGAKPLQAVLDLNRMGIAHGDIHGRNLRWQPATGKAVLLDFEMATKDRGKAEFEAAQVLRNFLKNAKANATKDQVTAIAELERLIVEEVHQEFGWREWRLPTSLMQRARDLLEAWNHGP